MGDDHSLKTSHMAIVLGIGLGVVMLIVLSLLHCLVDYDSPDRVTRAPCANASTFSLTIVVNRRDRQSLMRQRKNPDERLRHLDAVSPTRTLEQWWTNTKGKMGLSEAVDGQFVW
ncbi:hypothetical protein N7481_004055 [Penicillium waksmanii]|uniref:uncharacterized protein n=1 Tax=Penicillium waksmanii TaxID=69791 RepID=UPI002548786E|nr:uncharacterized protein N7481_004055 [Penicillium waksmanii]KAJ5988845.1 hypothetical protein N7481_004055 [Penicillium waksmanii]